MTDRGRLSLRTLNRATLDRQFLLRFAAPGAAAPDIRFTAP